MSYIVDIDNPWYPYTKVQEANIGLSDLGEIPRKLCDYFLDMPNSATGYTPKDDKTYPRARFWKYLFYDTDHPLDKQLPTPKQKMNLLFNPNKATEPPTDKGYRLIPQIYVKQAQTEAQTRVHIYLGRMHPLDAYKVSYSVVFDIFSHYAYENNTKDTEMSRTIGLEASIFEALNGVNMVGIGTFFCDRKKHPDCGSQVMHDETNVVRRLVMAFEVATTDTAKQNDLARIKLPTGGYFS